MKLGPFEKLDSKNLEHFDPIKYKMYPGDVLEHTIMALEKLPENVSDELLWGTFLHDVGKPLTQTFEDRIRFSGHDAVGEKVTEEILKRLKFSNEFIDSVCSLVKNHMKFSYVQNMRTSKLKRFMSLPSFEDHMLLHKADCESSHGGIENYDFLTEKLKTFEALEETFKVDKLPRIVTGHDLIKMGFEQGPIFRTILEDIQDQQLENIITEREQAIEYITQKYLGENNAGSSKNFTEIGCEK